MKVAAYQAPYFSSGSMVALDLIREQIDACEARGVEVLCCPEGILGGLADYAAYPAEISFNAGNGELENVLAPLASDTVTSIVGFTENDASGALYNSAAILYRRSILGIYRKLHPAINRSVYTAGKTLPVFHIDGLTFGILICNDSNFPEHGKALAANGATAVFIPSNNGLPPEKANVAAAARKADFGLSANGLSVIRSDVTGRADGRESYGTSAIIDSNGTILNSAPHWQEGLIIAEV